METRRLETAITKFGHLGFGFEDGTGRGVSEEIPRERLIQDWDDSKKAGELIEFGSLCFFCRSGKVGHLPCRALGDQEP